jgi:hypothetical protein
MAKNKSDLLAFISEQLPNNDASEITPEILRGVFNELVGSDFNTTDGGSVPGNTTFTGKAYYTGPTIEYTPTDNTELVTKQYVDNHAAAPTAGYGIGVNGSEVRLVSTVGTYSGTELDMRVQFQTVQLSVGVANTVNINTLIGRGIGRTVCLKYPSTNAGDTLGIAFSGTVNYPGMMFVPGITNLIYIQQANSDEYNVIIAPLIN